MSSPSADRPTPARIFETMRALQETAALKTAIEMGIFTAIGAGSNTAAAIAFECAASARGMRVLCDVLVTSGLLTKRDGVYGNAPDAALFLDRRSPAYLGTITEFLCVPEVCDGMLRDLTACVRKGGTTIGEQGTVSDDNPVWVKFARGMAPMARVSAAMVANYLPATGPLKVLDIAAGHGMYGIAVALRNPEARIYALDWAAVLEVAKENARAAGVADRHDRIPGSAFETEFGSDYDAVLLCGFLHHFDKEKNEALLSKVHAALKPGGAVVIGEFVPNEDRVSPPVAARFALTMLFTTANGDAYTEAEYKDMLARAGFSEAAHHRLETQQSVIIATK